MSNDEPQYPSDRRARSKSGNGIWALCVLRAMCLSGAANEIGHASCWLVSIVASYEDKFFYSKPVTFWNQQLMQAAGMSSKQSFLNARTKAVQSGWLVHIEGRKGVAGQYWTSIPKHALSVLGSSKSDENAGPDSDRQIEFSGPDSDRESSGESICRSGFRSESGPATGPHSYPVPTDPKKQGAALASETGKSLDDHFAEWYQAYPRKVGKGDAEKAYPRAVKKVAKDKRLSQQQAVEFLLAAVQAFAKSPAGNSGTYTKHPASWLNGKRYDDDRVEWHRDSGTTTGGHELADIADRIHTIVSKVWHPDTKNTAELKEALGSESFFRAAKVTGLGKITDQWGRDQSVRRTLIENLAKENPL